MGKDIFVCYESTTGQGYAKHLKKALEKLKKNKYKVFIADITLRSGSHWEEHINQALTDCDFFIVIITALTMNSAEVKKEYDKAIKMDKHIIPVRFSKIKVNETKELSRLQQITFSDKYELANEVIIELIKIEKQKLMDNENDSNELFKRGNLLFNLKQFSEALILYKKAIINKTNFPEAWANIGLIYSTLDNYKKALEAFEKAINLYPDFADAWLDKGIILNKLKKPQDALYALERAIEIDPNFADALYLKACLYSYKNDKKNTILFLSKAIKLDKTNKKEAKEDKDFMNFWKDDDFMKITRIDHK